MWLWWLVVAVLIVSAAFNVLTWPTFFRRVASDPRAHDDAGRRTSFYTVHLGLLVVALVIAVAELAAAVLLVMLAMALQQLT